MNLGYEPNPKAPEVFYTVKVAEHVTARGTYIGVDRDTGKTCVELDDGDIVCGWEIPLQKGKEFADA